MVVKDSLIAPPEDRQVKIWRYMDFAKFVAMLEYRGLFFSRADRLGDRFEGSYPQENVKARQQWLKRAGENEGWSPDKIQDANASVSGALRGAPAEMMVICWHMNEYESAGMWAQYGRVGKSICIQSTYQRLYECLEGTDREIRLGVVRYIDYDNERMPGERLNILHSFFHKRKSFEDERELRALIWMSEGVPLEFGTWLNVDLQELIERVYVAPSSPSWYRDLLERVAGRYDLKTEVIRSSLDEDPSW